MRVAARLSIGAIGDGKGLRSGPSGWLYRPRLQRFRNPGNPPEPSRPLLTCAGSGGSAGSGLTAEGEPPMTSPLPGYATAKQFRPISAA
jgi:hypothetical protein